MRTYAEGTGVPAHRTLEQLDKLLREAGAQDVTTGHKQDLLAVGFSFGDRTYRFTLPLPTVASFKTYMPKRAYSERTRTDEACEALRAQAVREKYRALFATVKAKLVSVQAGIESFEEAFLAHAVTAQGETVAQWLLKSENEARFKLPALPAGELQ